MYDDTEEIRKVTRTLVAAIASCSHVAVYVRCSFVDVRNLAPTRNIFVFV